MRNKTNIVLSLYPVARGFGYVCLEWPKTILDSGVATEKPKGRGNLLFRVKKFMDFYQPTLVIIRDYDTRSSRYHHRPRRLIQDIATYAKGLKLPVHSYSREQVRDVFEQFGATNRVEIAKEIIKWFPELANHAPKIRTHWYDDVDFKMTMFDAVALAITHKYLTGETE